MASDELKRGQILGGRFELEREAGVGGMGAVYRARDLLTGSPVAVKVVLASADIERFAREARVLEGVHHPAVVRYVTHGTTSDGAPYLVMEWLEGEDLEKRLTRGRLTVAESVTLARRVAGALAEVHARGVVHRDLKPSNLFLCGDRVDEAKILDFGAALAQRGSRRLSAEGATIGTPGYMAPEQARGEHDVDARADLFSLGCVLFECLTGRPPFAGAHVVALLLKVLFEEAPPVRSLCPEVPEALADVIARMMRKGPGERPESADAVVAALDTLDLARTGETPALSLALTAHEQRLLSVILIGAAAPLAPPAADEDPANMRTMSADALPFAIPALRALAAAHDAALDPLANGTWVLTLGGSGAATDRAALAARCALAVRDAAADVPVVLAMGRGQAGQRAPVGEVVERAARLLSRAPRAGAADRAVRVDELTAGLLGDRFEIEAGEGQLRLRREREVRGEDERPLLGRATPCVGRERELRTLEEVVEAAITEPSARAVLVTGDAGIGKSRLRRELVSRLRATGDPMEIWIARGEPLSARSPFGLLGQVIRRAAGVLEGEPLEERRRKLRARVGQRLGDEGPRVAEFLGELCGTPFPEEGSVRLRAARHDPVIMGDQMRCAWLDFMDAESRDRPLLLIFEDLHWGDLPTVQHVDAALRLGRERPLIVLALARPEVESLFPSLWSKRSLVTINLGALTRRACAELARDVLGGEAGAAKLEQLWERSAGNAFFLEELLRASVEGRGGEAPPTVLAMAQARLESLGAGARLVLRAASVFGERFWGGGVAALLGGAAPAEAITTLIDDEVITRARDAKFPGEIEYVFRHALVRDAAYGMLTDEDRAVGHRIAGTWLEGVGEGSSGALAEHFERGGDRGKAAIWYRRAAEQAFEGNDLALALAWAERGVLCAEGAGALDAGWLGETFLLQAQANRWRGQHRGAQRCGLEAMSRLPRGSASWYEAVAVVAEASGRSHELAQLEACCAALQEAAPPPAAPAGPARDGVAISYAIALARAARHGFFFAEHHAKAEVLLQRSEQVARRLEDDPSVGAEVARAQALHAQLKGDLSSFLALHASARAGFERAGDVRNACSEAMSVGNAYAQLGVYDAAERALRSALSEAERLGLSGLRAVGKHNLGLALALQGMLEEGTAVEEEAVALARDEGNRMTESYARIYLSRIALVAGDAPRAERECRSFLEEPTTLADDRAYSLAILAAASLAQGRPADALGAAQEAMDILASIGDVEECESLIRLGYAEALHATGDADRARAAVSGARARLLARADRITDPSYRRCFLERVPENARTRELARRLLGDDL